MMDRGQEMVLCGVDPVEIDFARWEATPPAELFGDAIWRLPAYRLSRYLALVVRDDVAVIRRRSERLADQLERSVDSIGINIAEGYGRLYGKDRARFYEFALGSAREAREWYARAEAYLDDGVAIGRAKLLSRVIRILTVAVPQERAGSSERRMREAARARERAATTEQQNGEQQPSASSSPSKEL